MTTERDELLGALREATDRLAAAIARLAEDEVRGPSLLPGWTRGHLITHVARNADALRNLLTWARTGVVTPAYAGPEEREAEIQAGAARTGPALRDDVRESADVFAAEAASLPAAAWDAEVSVLDGPLFPARLLLPRRLTEVELHHTDLGVGYRSDDWTPEFTGLDLPEPMRAWREERRAW
ncbi:hypothetical protein GCM10009830_19540 [Glycomyces endophyticus]|uniref:Mycothiol-dependent maleylpyruvate isomerase metal-binding domain-containing protein n=1 Tax=Glycomyces endophyticus TaxID=480996 RepID=A0ABP4SIA1_9ACTN